MENSSFRTAVYFGLLVLLLDLNTVVCTDKLFVADAVLGQIFLAETDGDSFLDSTLTPLNLTINESPVGIDYDYRNDVIYWSDQTTHTIHRSALNGSFDEVLANDTSVPHGIVLDLEEDKVFWLSASGGNLYRANLDGSNLEILDPLFVVPRGITISYRRRKLYVTTRDSQPAIWSVNTDGSDATVLIDTDISSPSGITFDFTEQRLYWADDSLDKVEAINPDDSDDRVTILSLPPGSGVDLYPFGIALHYEDVYFSDILSAVVVLADFPLGNIEILQSSFALPAEVHIYMDVCADRCLNNGTCIRHWTSVECQCPSGFFGPRCEFYSDVCANRCQNGGTCVPSERGSMCLCPDGFSGSRCELRSKYASLVFVCDEEAGVILESTADSLDFSPLPIDNLYRPIAVSYSSEQDMIFWIDAGNDTLNRAFRNGSGHVTIESTFEDFSDLTFSSQSQLLTYIADGSYLEFQQINVSRPSVNHTHDSDLTTICLHPNTDLYAFENGTIPNLYRYESDMTSERIPKPSLLSPRTMAFDRHGSRLFMLDDMKETLESCGPLGEDQQILLHYQNTKPVDVEWYQGTAFWSDSSSSNGIGFMAKRGGPSTGIASMQQFQTARGIYVYHGDSYVRKAGEDCLEDEFTCNDTVCIPLSWRCDGLVDCEHGLDEADCVSDEPDSLVFVTDLDLRAIFMATAINLSFTQLPLTGLQVPVAVEYDPVDSTVYWTDAATGTINSAQIDGTNQQTVISGLGAPDGLYFDGQTKTIYWTDAFYQTIDAFYPNGTGRVNLLSNLDNPRGIIIVSTNRLLYWTEWGNSPKIEMSDLNGQNRQVIIDTDLFWPNGITQNREGSRLYWCDAHLDKIESSDIYGGDRKLLIDLSDTGIHPFGIVFHHGTLMWTDWDFDGIGVIEGSPHAWPKRYILPGGFERPGGFHIFEDIDECDIAPCLNGGTCTDAVNEFICTCPPGYTGDTCEIDIDECASQPCENGGTCTNGVNMFNCTCLPRYTGYTCEIDIGHCNVECLYGGTCIDSVNKYICICHPGFTGDTCEIDIDECDITPCLNGGTCTDGFNEFICTCPPGYTGDTCEIVTTTTATTSGTETSTTTPGTTTTEISTTTPTTTMETSTTPATTTTETSTTTVTTTTTEISTTTRATTTMETSTTTPTTTTETSTTTPTVTTTETSTLTRSTTEGINTRVPTTTGTTIATETSTTTPTTTMETSTTPATTTTTTETSTTTLATTTPTETSTTTPATTTTSTPTESSTTAPTTMTTTESSTTTPTTTTTTTTESSTTTPSTTTTETSTTLPTTTTTITTTPTESSTTPTTTTVETNTATSPTTTTETSTTTPSITTTEASTITRSTTEGIDTRETTEEGNIEPIRVTSWPLSLTVNPLEPVEMMCSFENAIRFAWQKDNISIPGTENQNIYIITSMTPSHIGYYRCRGEGRNENGAANVVFTDQAALYITELSNIIVEDARFNINVTSPGDLSDSSSQFYQDAADTITNFVQTGMMATGQFEENSLFVVPSNLREGSIIANLNMYVFGNGTSPSQIRQDVEASFFALSQQDGILDTSTVRVTSTSICPRLTWRSRFGEVQFGEGEINTWSNSTGRDCPFNTTNANQPVATAQCVGDRISPAVWKPQDNCGVFRNVTELLREIDEVEITEDTVEEVTDHVSVITQNTEEITSSDITLVSNITAEIAAQNTSGKEVTAKVTNIVSNIASVDMAELQAAEESSNAISNMLIAYETQLNNVEVAEDEPFDVAEENLAVQVRSVPQDELGQGLVLSLSGDSSSDLSRSNITVRAGKDTPVEEERVGLIAEVSLPPEIAAIASGASLGKANNTNINIIMSVFATPVLFFSPSLLNFSRENEDVNRTANTPVILLSVGGVVIENLDQSINLTFTALEPGYENQTCVFWEETNSEWSSEGCRLLESGSGTSELSDDSPNASEGSGSDSLSNNIFKETYTCACNHLTNFAILMDVHNRTTEFTYNVLSYIGCAISIVCLVISLGTYLMNKKLRSRQSHQIFICLCATMLCLYVSFLTMLVLDTVRGASEVHPGACSFVAALIHFFVLSSISWMGVEGFNTYLVIVRIFNTYIPNFMIKAGLAAWGIPAIIVILTGGIANVNYAEEDVCFLQLWPRIGGLLIPMAVVLLANVVIFILVIRQLSKSSKVSGKVKKGKEHERQETIERIKNAVTILVLLGLTWITGYLLLIDAFTQVAQAVFILFNCFQGLFIFILYCLRKPVVRQQWGLTCSWCDRDDGERGARRFSSTSLSDSVTSFSKFFSRKSGRKYSIGESIVDTSKDGQSSGSISNPAYDDLVFGIYTPSDNESKI